jgi:hypothetical protein
MAWGWPTPTLAVAKHLPAAAAVALAFGGAATACWYCAPPFESASLRRSAGEGRLYECIECVAQRCLPDRFFPRHEPEIHTGLAQNLGQL